MVDGVLCFSLLFFSFFYYGTIPEALPNATLMILETSKRAQGLYPSVCPSSLFPSLLW